MWVEVVLEIPVTLETPAILGILALLEKAAAVVMALCKAIEVAIPQHVCALTVDVAALAAGAAQFHQPLELAAVEKIQQAPAILGILALRVTPALRVMLVPLVPLELHLLG